MADEKDTKKAEADAAAEEVKEETTEAPAKEEAPKEEVKEEAAPEVEEKKEVPAEFTKLVESIENLSVLQLSELVKVLEDRFGVSAQAAVAVAAGPAAGGAEAAEEKSSYTVHLADAGAQKIQVIKVVKEITGKGLKEAKDMVEGAPVDVMPDVKTEDAEEMKKKIEEAGGKVELK